MSKLIDVGLLDLQPLGLSSCNGAVMVNIDHTHAVKPSAQDAATSQQCQERHQAIHIPCVVRIFSQG